jgi:glycosyltransferase involved in cell wall biosynthesis
VSLPGKPLIDKPDITIITAVRNSCETIGACIESVQNQTFKNIEHIIIDGVSTDGTLDIIAEMRNSNTVLISEPDDGIYDAINKGIKLASGAIIGILHSDDVFDNETIIGTILKHLELSGTETCYGDLVYVSRADRWKTIRYWKAGEFDRAKFRKGWMPPHPTFFARKRVYEQYGYLDGNRFPLAADYELLLRLLYRYPVSASYLPQVLVRMSVGGTSNPGIYTVRAVIENYRAWKINDLKVNPFIFVLKPLSKLFQFLPRQLII